MSKYSKFAVALSGTSTITTAALADGAVSQAEGAQIALSLIAAVLVWLVPNYSPSKEPHA